jgi:hypothetical protein
MTAMGRGEYGSMARLQTYGRGTYGSWRTSLLVGRQLTDEEIRDATAAGNRAVQPLVDARSKMMNAWKPSTPLTREQMTQVMHEALKVATETEKNLIELIAKVPSHWEDIIRREGGLRSLRDAIDEGAGFQVLVDRAVTATVVPGFRAWIDRLLSRSESGVVVVAYVEDVLPDWLRMRRLLASFHRAGVAAIDAIVTLGQGVGSAVEALPTVVKTLGIGALLLGGVWVVSKLSGSSGSSSSPARSPRPTRAPRSARRA